MVRMKGLEPSLPFGNQNLNLARLPVSPHPHASLNYTLRAFLRGSLC